MGGTRAREYKQLSNGTNGAAVKAETLNFSGKRNKGEPRVHNGRWLRNAMGRRRGLISTQIDKELLDGHTHTHVISKNRNPEIREVRQRHERSQASSAKDNSPGLSKARDCPTKLRDRLLTTSYFQYFRRLSPHSVLWDRNFSQHNGMLSVFRENCISVHFSPRYSVCGFATLSHFFRISVLLSLRNSTCPPAFFSITSFKGMLTTGSIRGLERGTTIIISRIFISRTEIIG